MSLRLEMLQVARLASRQLGESRDLVAAYLHRSLNPDGGFQNRAGSSDLYYTVFGLDGLIALQETLPTELVTGYLRSFGRGEGLDLVHLACLARGWTAVSRDLKGVPVREILAAVEACRSDDGAYAPAPGLSRGTVYASFLALGAYQDLRRTLPEPERLADALIAFRAEGGGYANDAGRAQGGTTTSTAAAVLLLAQLEAPLDRHLGMWLLDRCHPSGGFFATPDAGVPDLLSTATALHALAALHVPLAGLHDACLDFVDSLWTNRGGFYGSWVDDTLDCEYTFYGLLALGHLSLSSP